MNYKELINIAESLFNSENDKISLLAHASAFLNEYIDDINWVGFYLDNGKELVLGPFQGKVACSVIPYNKGVCGHTYALNETVVVDNVHDFEGHIACDSKTNSEVVIPLENIGVLDFDSESFSRFDKPLVRFIEQVSQLLLKRLHEI